MKLLLIQESRIVTGGAATKDILIGVSTFGATLGATAGLAGFEDYRFIVGGAVLGGLLSGIVAGCVLEATS